jgi:peptidoglycan-N-acetylglucosamine deacetylase
VNPLLIAVPIAIADVAAAAIYGGRYPRAQMFGPVTWRTSSPRKLAITFDDGPNPSVTPKLLELLDRHQASATFFLIGRYAQERPDLVKEIAARRHVIGNHTQTHPNLFWLGPAQVRDELRRCHDAIANAMQRPPNWFRPPFGWRNPWVAAVAQELHMQVATWTLLPGDWHATSDEWLIQRLQPIGSRAGAPPARPQAGGDILCLHDGSHRGQNADRSHTLAALEYWLPQWRDLGLEFVTIEDAVRTPAS